MKKVVNLPGICKNVWKPNQPTKTKRTKKTGTFTWLKKLISSSPVTPASNTTKNGVTDPGPTVNAQLCGGSLPVYRVDTTQLPKDHLAQDEQEISGIFLPIECLRANGTKVTALRSGPEVTTMTMDNLTLIECDSSSSDCGSYMETGSERTLPNQMEDSIALADDEASTGDGLDMSTRYETSEYSHPKTCEGGKIAIGNCGDIEMYNGTAHRKFESLETVRATDPLHEVNPSSESRSRPGYEDPERSTPDLRKLTCEEMVLLLSNRPQYKNNKQNNGMYEKWQETPCCFDDFRFIKQLGYGSFGTVWHVQPLRGVYPSGKLPKDMALKIISIEELGAGALQDIQGELNVHKNLPKHDHIIRAGLSFRQNGHQYIGMEMLRGGNLREWLDVYDGHIPERAILMIMYQVLDALDCMHANQWAHRDIKLENIMLQEPFDPYGTEKPHIKLIDFSFATRWENGKEAFERKGLYGTEGYMAPQMLIGPHSPEASDLYSVGALLYKLVTRKYAIRCGVKNIRIYEQCRDEDYDFSGKVWKKFDHNTIMVCRSLMKFLENDRMRADEALVLVDDILHRVYDIDMRDGEDNAVNTDSQNGINGIK